MQKDGIRKLFSKSDIKCTKKREWIYETLLRLGTPVSAEALYQMLLKEMTEEINLSTVYRTLDVFTQKGLVLKNTLSVDDRATYEINHNEHRHHLMCVSCGEITPITGCPLAAYEKELIHHTGYRILEHKLEILGVCPNCQLKETLITEITLLKDSDKKMPSKK